MLELAEKVIAKTKSKSRITFKRLPDDDPSQRKTVITPGKEQLGWEPSIALDDGLEKTIAYFIGMSNLPFLLWMIRKKTRI